MRVLIASLTLLVAACGFQPMYSPGNGAAIGPVQIAMIEGKAGHVLKTELDRMLMAENSAASPATLEITLNEQVSRLGLRRDESATRGELRLVATYVLTPGDGRAAMFALERREMRTNRLDRLNGGRLSACLKTDSVADPV